MVKYRTLSFLLIPVFVSNMLLSSAAADYTTKAVELTAYREHPSLFVTASPTPGLRSLADVRAGIQSGHARDLWDALKAGVDLQLAEHPITPMQEKDGQRVLGNRPFWLVANAANRILDTALVALVLEDRKYVDGTLKQIMALFDENEWPEWSDQAHLNAGLHCDLRHGQLVMPVAVAYDWLYNQLTPEERKAIIDGLDRCAITPYKEGFAAGEHWSRRKSNWMTVVLGGFGIAGMALGPDHPDSAMLVANSLPQMETYLDILGPEGEFNESVQYAGSMAYVVRYFMAMRYASRGTDNPFERHALDKFYDWYMMMTFPPGRVAGFGDPAPDMPPVVVPAAAVAAATRNQVFQWFYEKYHDTMLESHRKRALELLYYDATLEPKSPAGILPLGRAYHAQGQLVSSRSSWDPTSCISVVYGKSGREDYHGHADWGQVCIDGYGERLLVDLGSPPGYPKDHADRYYNYQQFGHNVFMFGENETGGIPLTAKGVGGKTVWSEFDDKKGAAWTFDLSGVYGEGYTVTRTVAHLLPRTMVVLDQAKLPEVQPISLRWHLANPTTAEGTKNFDATGSKGLGHLDGWIERIDGDAATHLDHHAYAPPYNRHRLGEEFVQRNEPYLELSATDDRCRVLTAFEVYGPGNTTPRWDKAASENAWSIDSPEGHVTVKLDGDTLNVSREDGNAWRVTVPTP